MLYSKNIVKILLNLQDQQNLNLLINDFIFTLHKL